MLFLFFLGGLNVLQSFHFNSVKVLWVHVRSLSCGCNNHEEALVSGLREHSSSVFWLLISHSFLPFDVAAPEDKGTVTHALCDSARLGLRSSNQRSPESRLLNEAKETTRTHPAPQFASVPRAWPPPLVFLWPCLSFPRQVAADLDKEVGCSFQRPSEACCLGLPFLSPCRTAGSAGLKASIYICLGVLPVHF